MYFNIILNLILPILLLVLGIVVGSMVERQHFRSIRYREDYFKYLPVTNNKIYKADQELARAEMITSSVVVSIDYFKAFLAFFRNLAGGEVRSYLSLFERGRREAILRLQERCPQADIIINVRLETSRVSQGGIEVLAYGTAIKYKK